MCYLYVVARATLVVATVVGASYKGGAVIAAQCIQCFVSQQSRP